MQPTAAKLLSALGLLGIAWANSFPGSNVAIDTRTLDEIYAAAKLESGALTVAWGGDENYQGDPVRAAWAETFPEIELNLTVDVSKYHDSRIDRSWQRGNEYVDVAVLQTLHDFTRWKLQGRLLPYKPAPWESLWPSVKDTNGAFVPIAFYGFGGIVYNPTQLSSANLPTSFADFILPAWKGKLVITYPNDDDAIAYLFSLIIGKYGWGWFEALATQDVQWVRGTATPGAILAKNTTRSISFSTGGEKYPFLKKYFFDDEQVMAWAQTGAIFSSTKRPESAKLFISWLLSDSVENGAASAGLYVTREDIPLKVNSTVWDNKVSEPIGFNRFMIDRTGVGLWKLQFESTIGTAQGISPLDDDI